MFKFYEPIARIAPRPPSGTGRGWTGCPAIVPEDDSILHHLECQLPLKYIPRMVFHSPHNTMNYLCYSKRWLTLMENNNVYLRILGTHVEGYRWLRCYGRWWDVFVLIRDLGRFLCMFYKAFSNHMYTYQVCLICISRMSFMPLDLEAFGHAHLKSGLPSSLPGYTIMLSSRISQSIDLCPKSLFTKRVWHSNFCRVH